MIRQSCDAKSGRNSEETPVFKNRGFYVVGKKGEKLGMELDDLSMQAPIPDAYNSGLLPIQMQDSQVSAALGQIGS